MAQIFSYFNFDAVTFLMIGMVVFIGICVAGFASRYMKGDRHQRRFYVDLAAIILTVAILVSSDHLALFFVTLLMSNIILVRLMIHKRGWSAARVSGFIALKYFALSGASIAIAFFLLYTATGQTSIQHIVHSTIPLETLLPTLIFLLIGAMSQSAIWPFHRWLTSSLNSPTPVSAIMHAGIVNGGGFLLVRFAPLYLQLPQMLTVIFAIGIFTAFIGTLWKLMQNDVKRMLACSTMSQMGFMLAQCGLGLYPAAVAHLIWHGMFKAYLFLASGGAAQEKRLDLHYPPKPVPFICAMICGWAGSIAFGVASGKFWMTGDTTVILMIIVFLTGSQFALPLLRQTALRSIPLALFITSLIGLIYGANIHVIAWVMEPMQLMQPQPLNSIHISGAVLLSLAWLSMLFLKNSTEAKNSTTWILKGYVAALNSSQPHPNTITAYRTQYHY